MLGFFVYAAILAAPCATGRRIVKNRPRDTSTPSQTMFVFGDSYTTTGFNISAQPQPSIASPLGNPEYPGATLSGGENWIDIVIYNNSRNSTIAYNYAVGGDTVNETQIQNNQPPQKIQDFINQEAEFETLASTTGVMQVPNNTIFVAWFGINDVAIQINQGRNFEQSTTILGPDINDYFILLYRLYTLGARNFVTILVPPIYRAPDYGYGKSSNAPKVRNLTEYWNMQIQSGNTAFQKQNADAKTRIVDPSPIFNQILDNPGEYGAPNSTCTSYPAGEPCLWHDFIHPGLAIQKAFGNVMSEALSGMGF